MFFDCVRLPVSAGQPGSGGICTLVQYKAPGPSVSLISHRILPELSDAKLKGTLFTNTSTVEPLICGNKRFSDCFTNQQVVALETMR